jgi:zinc protease
MDIPMNNTFRFVAAIVSAIAIGIGMMWFGAPARAVEIQRIISPGGIEIWYVHEPSLPIIAVEIAFENAGNSSLPEGKQGLANMVSSLLDEGAGDMESLAFQRRMDELSISMRASDNADTFRMSLRTLSDVRDGAFELLGLALTAPRFDAVPVERMRAGILSDLNRRINDPDYLLGIAWLKTAYPGHVYGRPSRGTIEIVEGFTQEDFRDFVATRFTKDRLKVGAVGDVDGAEISRLIDAALGGLPATGPAFEVTRVDPIDGPAFQVIRQDIPQSSIIWGTTGLMREDPDYYAGVIMNTVLGGASFISRMWQSVREDRGLAYSVGTGISPMAETSYFTGGVATRNDQVAEAYAIIEAEMQRMAEEGVSDQELADAKSYSIGNFALGLDTNSSIARVLVGLQVAELDIDYIDKRAGYINAVTKADVLRVARRIFWGDGNATSGTLRMITTIVGDPGGFEDK